MKNAQEISFSFKNSPENNFPQFSSTYFYSSHSYASNDTMQACIIENNGQFSMKVLLKKISFSGKSTRKIIFSNFHISTLKPLSHTRPTIIWVRVCFSFYKMYKNLNLARLTRRVGSGFVGSGRVKR